MAMALACAPFAVHAQTPGTRFEGTIDVTRIELRGDTVTVSYRVYARATSPEPFFAFTLPLTQSPITVQSDPVSREWRGTKRVGRLPVAGWAYLGEAVPAESPMLMVTALGIPELTDAWVQGAREPFTEGTPQADSSFADTTGYQYGSRKVRVVGIGPMASTLTLDERLARLTAGLSERCQLGAITSQGTCRSLEAKLTAARASIGRNNSNAARGQLGAFKAELSAQRGKAVDETSYWLLSTLADLVMAGLPTR